jgi:D-lactate dehydrogenase (quinone)
MDMAAEPLLSPAAHRSLTETLGESRLHVDLETRGLYASDDGPGRCLPLAVAFPTTHEQVVALVQAANAHRFALVARGAGSGNVGGALPVPGSVVVSFECMREVLEFNAHERLIVAQTGVPTAHIDALARSRGLFYAPDPGSAPYCRLGGNLAMNAAGPRAVKYGATRDYVLGLKAVTGDGRTLIAGGRTTKRATGYDLTRLLVGNEGTLALITEATLRLLPAPAAVGTLRVCFDSARHACDAVMRVMAQAVVPSALEFMDRFSVAAIERHGPVADLHLPPNTGAVLMVEADGDPDIVARDLGALKRALTGDGMIELREAHDADEVAMLWQARRALSPAVKKLAPLKINEDVAVPVTALSDFIAFIETLAQTYRLPIVCFGHAGNGNLHVNVMVRPDDSDEMRRADEALDRLFRTVIELKGTISGEHGIGEKKRRYLPLELASESLTLMRQLKAVFDPNNVLNPGKLFPDMD